MGQYLAGLPVGGTLAYGHRNDEEFHMVLTQVKNAAPNV